MYIYFPLCRNSFIIYESLVDFEVEKSKNLIDLFEAYFWEKITD